MQESRESLAWRCKLWNDAYPPGTPVTARRGDGSSLETVTASWAFVLDARAAVILLRGVRPWFSLDCVTPQTQAPSPKVES